MNKIEMKTSLLMMGFPDNASMTKIVNESATIEQALEKILGMPSPSYDNKPKPKPKPKKLSTLQKLTEYRGKISEIVKVFNEGKGTLEECRKYGEGLNRVMCLLDFLDCTKDERIERKKVFLDITKLLKVVDVKITVTFVTDSIKDDDVDVDSDENKSGNVVKEIIVQKYTTFKQFTTTLREMFFPKKRNIIVISNKKNVEMNEQNFYNFLVSNDRKQLFIAEFTE